ncbi:MAG: M48 family metallopeptidase [Planctomyces sp.]|nr:M48 family metallopeptidase [Planctomyces sp.]
MNRKPLFLCWRRWSTGLALLGLGTTATITLTNSGCQTAPITQRKQVLLVSEQEENALGLNAYQEVLKSEPVSKNERYAELVRRVGQRIAKVANRPDFEWEFTVIESETQNAFCLPGGKVAIYTGILPVCESEAGLAVVMSHEIAHAIARHGGERMTNRTIQNLGQKATAYVMKNQEEQNQKIVLAAYGGASEYGAILPFSRKHEMEADHIGVMLMAKAGYDPSEAPVFWERFAAEKGGEAAPMEFLSTHPSDARRSGALRELLPEAMGFYEQSAEKYGLGEQIR